jgi:hypothetical protein
VIAIAAALAFLSTGCGSTLQHAAAGGGEVVAEPLYEVGTGDTSVTLPTDDTLAPGSTLPGDAAPTPGSGRAPTASDVAPVGGGAAVTGPITLGFLIEKSANATGSFGFTSPTTLRPSTVYPALVNAMNKAGGMAGRRIEPVYAEVDSAANDYSTMLQAVCERLTRDNHVAAVLAGLGAYSPTFEACLQGTTTPHLDSGFVTGDSRDLQTYPLLISTGAFSVDRRVKAMAEVAIVDGWLTSANKLGVLLDDCPRNHRAYDSLTAILQSHGMAIADSGSLRCTTGFGSAGDAAAAMQNFVLSFRQTGVDRVLIISDFEAVGFLLFAQSAESQRYRPGYVLSSVSGAAALAANIPAEQLKNVHGAGWLAAVDVTNPQMGPNTKRCFDLIASEGLQIRSTADMYSVTTACDVLFLYEAGLRATAGDANAARIVPAMLAAAQTYEHPAMSGPSALSATRHDGASAAQAFGYEPSCGCLRYRGSPLPIP